MCNLFQNSDDNRVLIPANAELMHNPKYEELFAPTYGPENPFQTQQMKANRNVLAGFVERAHISDFQFENQRRTFTSYGYAMDPSTDGDAETANSVVCELYYKILKKKSNPDLNPSHTTCAICQTVIHPCITCLGDIPSFGTCNVKSGAFFDRSNSASWMCLL